MPSYLCILTTIDGQFVVVTRNFPTSQSEKRHLMEFLTRLLIIFSMKWERGARSMSITMPNFLPLPGIMNKYKIMFVVQLCISIFPYCYRSQEEECSLSQRINPKGSKWLISGNCISMALMYSIVIIITIWNNFPNWNNKLILLENERSQNYQK